MPLAPDRFHARLERDGLAPNYFLFGEEPLQLREMADALRAQARATGIEERLVFDAEQSGDWEALAAASQALSLFASRRLLELRLGQRNPDKRGQDVLESVLARPGDDDILLVIGHFNSTCSLAAKEEYNRVGIVEFSPGSTNVKVCAGGPFTFRNLYRDDYQGDQIALYLKHSLNLKNAAVLFDNDDYGKGLMQSFKRRAEKEGLEIVATVSYLRERTHLPIVVDPSHGTGIASLVPPMCRAAVAVGCDGLLIEVHPDPSRARSDGAQTLTPVAFAAVMGECRRIAEAVGVRI